MRLLPSILAGVGLLLPSVPSFAHIDLDYPLMRPTGDQKVRPCATATRSTRVTTLRPGATITVRWHETINHPGWFRIAFDTDGQNDFMDPATNSQTNPTTVTIQQAPVAPVLLDGINQNVTATTHTAQVTLPNTPCTNCTLQLVQIMTDKFNDGVYNEFYYRCADIVLDPNAPVDGGATPDAGGTPDAGAAGGAGGNGGSGGAGGAGGGGTGGAGGDGGGGSAGGGRSGGGGGAGGDGGSSATGGTGGKKASSSGGGCAYGGPAAAPAWLLLAALALTFRRRRR